MSSQLLELLVLAVAAGVVLVKLYSVLGKRTGAEPPPRAAPQPAQGELARAQESVRAPSAPIGAAGPSGLSDVVRADPSFDPEHFVTGARAAYEMIVQAFAKGDRDALRPLLTERVYDAYDKAIAARAASGEPGVELVRLKAAELTDVSLDGSVARAVVKFESELAAGQHGLRDAREKWTFERDVTSRDPNWRLARVVAA
ncbi:MAG: Tim44/TimA family putative adaptor protein [Hyphomonadaceae bacterium]|nr:Tim44/TimA family putative adaptor protein [Hyphomonadaceae bacterium]